MTTPAGEFLVGRRSAGRWRFAKVRALRQQSIGGKYSIEASSLWVALSRARPQVEDRVLRRQDNA